MLAVWATCILTSHHRAGEHFFAPSDFFPLLVLAALGGVKNGFTTEWNGLENAFV